VILDSFFYALTANTFSGFSCICFSGDLQIPLAPQLILCGPQELNAKSASKMYKVFFIFLIIFIRFEIAYFSVVPNNLFGWIILEFYVVHPICLGLLANHKTDFFALH
jgi:hypothetical protein